MTGRCHFGILGPGLFAVIIALTGNGRVHAEDGWKDYKPSSLNKAFAAAAIVEGTDWTIETLDVKYAVEAEYTGQHQELPEARKTLFRAWALSLSHPQLYSHEVQVRDGKRAYWLPIQDVLLKPLSREARQGSHLRLKIMVIGAVGKEPVFAINEFEVLRTGR